MDQGEIQLYCPPGKSEHGSPKLRRLNTLSGKARSIVNDKQDKVDGAYRVYLGALEEAVRALPGTCKEYQSLMNRITRGFFE